MKNLFKFVSVFLFLFFANCTVIAQDAGDIHNAMLQKYYDIYGFDTPITNGKDLSRKILDIGKELYPEKYSNQTYDDIDNLSYTVFEGNEELVYFDYKLKVKQMLVSNFNSGLISLEYKDLMTDIFENEYSVNVMEDMINAYLLNSEILPRETEFSTQFLQMAPKSFDYWTQTYKRKYRCRASHQIYMADLAGGLLGLASGGALSLVLGVACSAGMDEVQYQNGGGCV